MLENPYRPGSTSPGYLSGRGQELAIVDELGARVRSLGRPGGPLLAFYGPRGTGKTSLLRHAQGDAHQAGMFTAWVTGRGDRPMVESLAKSVNRAVSAAPLGEKAKAILNRIEQVQVEFGVPGAKGRSAVGRLDGSRRCGPRSPRGHCSRFARTHGHHGLVLFVDEFHEASVEDRKSLLIALQEFDGDTINPTPVGIVAAGLPSIHGAITEAATFGERTRFVEVKGLTPAAAAEALRVPAENIESGGVRWDDEAIAAAVELADTYPHKVQIVGSCTWDFARPEPGSTITVGHVRGAAEAIELRMDDLYRTRWAAARPEHRRFLRAMAACGDDSASREEIAAAVGTTTNALSRPRDQLIERGLIAPAGRGRLAFTIPGFGAHIRRLADTDRERPMGRRPCSTAGRQAGHREPDPPGGRSPRRAAKGRPSA